MRIAAAMASVLLLAGCSAVQGEAPPSEPQGTLTIFAAASLTETFDAIATELEQLHPSLEVVINYGGSSALATQIVQGAPADLFAAASPEAMRPVVEAGLTSNPIDFATNTLEIATPAGNPGGVKSLADFTNPDLAIALCAVEVPCGAAAKTVLDDAGLTPSVDTYEQDVKAVLTKVVLGEVDAGLVYVTDVIAAGDAVEGIEFPSAAGAVARYQIAPLTTKLNSAAVGAFLSLLQADGQGILEAAGFGAP